jgi:hypothetical protein
MCFTPRSFVPHRLFSFVSLVHWGAFTPPLCGVAPYSVRRPLWSAVASPIPRLRTTPTFKVRLQQGFAPGEMGLNDKFTLQKS